MPDFDDTGGMAGSASAKAWHISPSVKREAIAVEGLTFVDTPSACIWMFIDRRVAESYLGRSWGGSRGVNDLWEIDVRGLELRPEHHPFDEPASVTVAEPIAPARLTLIAAHTPAGGIRRIGPLTQADRTIADPSCSPRPARDHGDDATSPDRHEASPALEARHEHQPR